MAYMFLIWQVLDEIGVDIHSKMATAPKTKITQAQQQAETDKEDAEADDLIARLSALKWPPCMLVNVPVYFTPFIA